MNSWPKWADQFILESVPDPSWRLLASRLPVHDAIRRQSSSLRDLRWNGRGKHLSPDTSVFSGDAGNGVGDEYAIDCNRDATRHCDRRIVVLGKCWIERCRYPSIRSHSNLRWKPFSRHSRNRLPGGSTMPPARIVGGDLQLMGITQNQQVRDFAKTNLPLRTVLTDLVVGANSDKSAVGPSDPKQTLIWVVADDPARPGKPGNPDHHPASCPKQEVPPCRASSRRSRQPNRVRSFFRRRSPRGRQAMDIPRRPGNDSRDGSQHTEGKRRMPAEMD